MWVLFLRDFDFTPPERRTVTIAYRAGDVFFVRRICAELAIGHGCAVITERPAWRRR